MNITFIKKYKTIWHHAGFQRYFANTGWLLVARFLTLIISFIATIVIARALGPTNFGELSYALSFISIFSIIATLGVDMIVYRELIQNPSNRETILGSSFIIKLSAGTIASLLAIISATFFAKDVSTVLIVILSGTFILNAFQITTHQFQATSLSKYPAIISIIVTLILNISKIIVVYYGKGVIYLAGVLLLESILYAVLYSVAYAHVFKKTILSWKIKMETIKSILTDSYPLIFSGAFALIYARVDQIFIKHMIDAKAVGIYDAAVRIAEVWYFLPGIIVTALFPAILNAKKVSKELYHERIRRLGVLLFGIAIGIATIITLTADPLINIVYGEAFVGAALILQIYVWGGVGMFLGALAINYLVAENYRHILFFMSLLPMIINVILNIMWIPLFGITGAAWATLISYMFTPLPLLIFKKTRRIFFK